MHKRYFNIQSLLSNINQWTERSSKSIFTQKYFSQIIILTFWKKLHNQKMHSGNSFGCRCICLFADAIKGGTKKYCDTLSNSCHQGWLCVALLSQTSDLKVPAKETCKRKNKTWIIFLFISCSWIVYYDKVNQ